MRHRPHPVTLWMAAAVWLALQAPPVLAAARIHPMLRATLEQADLGQRAPSILRASGLRSDAPTIFPERIGVWVRTHDGGAALESAGLLSAAPRQPLRTARWTVDELRRAALDPSVEALSPAVRCQPTLDASLEECNITVAHESVGNPPVYVGLTGAGVLVGIVDSGIDPAHEDFLDDLGDTRLVSIWDQTVASTDNPTNYDYGKEWMAAQIDAGAVTEFDGEGHGTHVAGTAAGDGSATGNGELAYRFVGVAPESPMVVVKTDFLSTSIVDAVNYCFQKADSIGIPAVVNLSLGSHYGAHDGTDDMSAALSLLAGPGHIIVAAAGNEHGDGVHAETVLSAPNSASLTFEVPAYSPTGGSGNDEVYFDGWYTGGTDLQVTITSPNGHFLGPVAKGASVSSNTPDGRIEIDNDAFASPNGDHEVYVHIIDVAAGSPPESGTWTVTLDAITTVASPATSEFDAWIFYYSMPTPVAWVNGLEEAEIVASPATADSVIAVAAYLTKKQWGAIDGQNWGYGGSLTLGEIASFSSPGPRRDGVVKPDIAAPGMGIAAALSADASFPQNVTMPDGVHVLQQGTSMACPHVAGLVALMIEERGVLSVAEVWDRLTSTARNDGFTGAVPNSTWGHGKIEALGATGYVVPVSLVEAEAAEVNGRVFVSFLLSEDAGTNPLPIWREDPWDPQRRPMGFTSSGRTRTFVDSTLVTEGTYRYWLELDDAGSTVWIGPATIQFRPQVRTGLWASPNPFLAASQVAWRIPETAVSLSIVDVAGRQVRTIEDPVHLAGGTFAWDGTDDRGARAASGLYLVRLVGAGGGEWKTKILRLR